MYSLVSLERIETTPLALTLTSFFRDNWSDNSETRDSVTPTLPILIDTSRLSLLAELTIRLGISLLISWTSEIGTLSCHPATFQTRYD